MSSDVAQLCVIYALELCDCLNDDTPPETVKENTEYIQVSLSQLKQRERADVIASIRTQLADKDSGARTCQLLGLDPPSRAGDDVAWVADGVIAEMLDALGETGYGADAIASMFDLLVMKTPTEHILYRRLLRERLKFSEVDYNAALRDARGRNGSTPAKPKQFDLSGALDAYEILKQRHEDYLMDCIKNPHAPEPDWLELIKEIISKSKMQESDVEIFLNEVGKPPFLVKRKKTALKNHWRAVHAGQQMLMGSAVVGSTEKPESWPYAEQNGKLVYLTERSFHDNVTITSTPIADFCASITHEITDEANSRIFLLAGRAVRGGDFSVEIEAEDFGNDRKLKGVLDAASGSLDPVRAGMAKHLGASIKLLTKENERKKIKRYRRTGWDGEGLFLIPGKPRPGIEVQLTRKPPYRVSDDKSLDFGIEALDALLESMDPQRATIAASLIFQAPLARLVNWENERYAVFISGRTGSLKTSFVQVLMSIYGHGFMQDELLVKWGEGATANAMMGLATMSHDMPFLIDNYKPSTGGGARAFVSLIHNIVEGGEKDRMNRSAQLRESKPLFCWPICTGEDVPDSDPASLARILVVPFAWQRGEDNDALTKAQKFSEHLPAVGHSWLSWLESEDGQVTAREIAAGFEERRSAWSAILKSIRQDIVNPLRVASNLASNELAWEIVCKHPRLGAMAEKYKEAHGRGLREIVAVAMAEATAEALEATRYLTALRELLAVEQIAIPDMDAVVSDKEKQRLVGWRDSEGIYLMSGIARKSVEMLIGDLNGVSSLALNKQLYNLGMIASRNKGRYTKAKRINGKVEQVLHLTAGALDASGEEKDEEIPF